jgi:hypothetical protein
VKRRIVIILLILFAGAIINVCVAWGLAVTSFPIEANGRVYASAEVRGLWDPRVPDPLTYRPFYGYTFVAIGVDELVLPGGRVEEGKPAVRYKIILLDAGVPMRSMRAELGGVQGSPHAAHAITNPFGAPARHFRSGRTEVLLPLCPLPRGFAVNTVSYAAILWLLICGPRALRRRLRIRRQRCPACGYPLGTSPVCTECGREVSRWIQRTPREPGRPRPRVRRDESM